MLLFKTQPHAEHEVTLVEDAANPEDRIYKIQAGSQQDAAVSLLGSEIASLCVWWQDEKKRQSQSPGDQQ